jgi:hypothetical protein
LGKLSRSFDLRQDVQPLTERSEVNVVQGILEGVYTWDETRKQEDGVILELRREFKRDKLKKLLIQHRLRLCTITKKEYVSGIIKIVSCVGHEDAADRGKS